jgi:hypothetical protein
VRGALPLSFVAVIGGALGGACVGSRGSSGNGEGAQHDAGKAPPPSSLFDANPTPPATVAGVTPSHAFLARHTEIVVNGYSTSWTSSTQVDLGAGIAITNLSAPAPNFLAVDFAVDATAKPGPRDVIVIEGDASVLVGRGALTLDPPVALTFDGTLATGSIVVAHMAVLDPSTPLDTTATTNAFGVPTYTNLTPVLPVGLSATVIAATPLTADLQLFVDATTSGADDFDLLSGPPASAADAAFPLPAGMNVAARAGIPLTTDAAVTGSVDTTYATGLFVYTPPSGALSIVDFSATSAASAGQPAVLLLPATGRWSDELTGGAVATWLTSSTDPIYAVYFDETGSTGAYSVGVTATAVAASAAASAGDGTMATAVVAAGLPFVLTGGQLTSMTSQDWIQVATGPGDAGKHLQVQSAGDPQTFLDVTIYDDQGDSIGGNENGGPVHALTGPLAPSRTYYVAFSAGAGFDPTHGAYEGILRLQ